MLASCLSEDFEIRFPYCEKYAPLVKSFGFPTFTCQSFDPDKVLDHSRKFSFEWINEPDLKKIFMSQVNCISVMKPSLVVGDASFTLKMAAEKSGVKMIGLINGYMSRYYAFTRRLSRTHPAYHYSKNIPVKLFDRVTNLMEQLAFKRIHASFKAMRKQERLSPVRHYLDELTGDFTLLCDLPEIFPQKKLPVTHDFIGPLFFQSNDSETNLISCLDKSRKTILVALGSTGDWDSLKFLCNEKFSDFNIITAGDQLSVLHGLHILPRQFLNTTEVLPHTDLMICHGGNGTIYQALSIGIPVLGITNMFEQEWNMHRVEELGLGETLAGIKDEDTLYEKVKAWINRRPRLNLSLQIAEFNPARRREIFMRASNALSVNR